MSFKERFLTNVLAKIKPGEPERTAFKAVADSFLQLLNARLKQAQAIMGGSGAKDTWLAGSHDADIFVLFNYQKFSSKSAELSGLLEPILKKTFPKEKINRVHGSRDYFQLNYKQFFFEVIPILNISSAKQALNITDVSPLHSRWVNQHTKKLKEEIRLLKQFCKAQKGYGAESYIGGFSGYVLEILVAAYGSFKNVLIASKNWKINTVIDVKKHYRNSQALFELNASKRSPLIVIDPVDKSRNAAAALTLDKFSLFKDKAKDYLKNPGEDFFVRQPLTKDALKIIYPDQTLVYVEAQEFKGKRDVVGSKLLKAFAYLKQNLQKFEIVFADWDWNKFYFVVKKGQLPEFAEKSGPPLAMEEAVANFKKKNKSTYVKSGRIYSKIKIKHFRLGSYLKQLFADDYFKKKVQKVRICRLL